MTELKRPKRSVDDASWRKLHAIILSDEAFEARVLELMMATGMRVGDIFRIQRSDATSALRDGELLVVQKKGSTRIFHLHAGSRPRAALERMVNAWPRGIPTVLCVLADSCNYMTAYSRVDRHFKKIAEAIPGRINTHRLRRTIATQTWRQTKDLRAVQAMLGHKNMMTSQIYVDELAPDELAGLQDNVHSTFLGEEE